MKRTIAASVVVGLIGSGASAGVDQSGQPIGAIFEDGTYYQFNYGIVMPTVTGAGTSDATPSFSNLGFAIKGDFTDRLSYAIIYDEPYGASVQYNDGPFAGGFADVTSNGVTLLMRYKLDNGFSLQGGARAINASGTIASIGLLDASSDWGFTPVVGVAWEKPEIAARVALTYTAPVTLNFTGTENFAPVAFDMEFPESWTLDLQTGVNEKTLVFGQIRHVPWAGTNLTAGAGTYVNFTDDETTYTLGVGRRLSEDLSGLASITYLAPGATPTTNTLAPTNGRTALNVGLNYDMGDGIAIAGGLSYQILGDQNVLGVDFTGNNAWGAGFRVTVSR